MYSLPEVKAVCFHRRQSLWIFLWWKNCSGMSQKGGCLEFSCQSEEPSVCTFPLCSLIHIMKEKIFIIAEAGVNHNGDQDMAFRLVDAAAEAGADAVKFQTFKAELLVTGDAGKAEYQKSSTAGDDSQINMLRGLELDGDMHHRLAEYCKEKGILFLSTAFDLPSVDLLDSMGWIFSRFPPVKSRIFFFLEKSEVSESRSSCPRACPCRMK